MESTTEPTAEPTAEDAAQEAQAFAEGFGETTPTAGSAPPPAAPPTPAPSGAPATDVPTAEPGPTPEYAQVTKEDVESFRQTVAAVKELKATVEKQFGTAFGNLGGLKRALDQLQASTPSGQPLSVSDDDFAELKEEFPDLTALTIKGLNRVLGKLKGTRGGVDPAATLPPEVAESIAAQAAERADQKTSIRLLSYFQPEWREIVGRPDDANAYRTWLSTLPPERQVELLDTWDAMALSDSIDEFVAAQQDALEGLQPGWQELVGEEGSDTPYRRWLDAQPEAYQSRIRETWDPSVLADSLARFHAQGKSAPAAPAATARTVPAAPHPQKARVAAAVQPKGAGAPPPRGGEPTEAEAFEAAFSS